MPAFFALWGWPLALALLSATGLAAALVSDAWGDWWSWFGLGAPVAVSGWFAWPRAQTAPAPATPARRAANSHSHSHADTGAASAQTSQRPPAGR